MLNVKQKITVKSAAENKRAKFWKIKIRAKKPDRISIFTVINENALFFDAKRLTFF